MLGMKIVIYLNTQRMTLFRFKVLIFLKQKTKVL